MNFDSEKARQCIQSFDFKDLFIDVLGWSQPGREIKEMARDGGAYRRRQVAQLSGVVVFEVTADGGRIPDAKTRAALHKEIAALHHENLLIFVDKDRSQSLWYWVKRQDSKTYPREHLYVRGQPGDLFLSKLAAMVVDMSELDEAGNIPVTEVASRLKEALDVERVTKKFYTEFQQQHIAFLDLIRGIDDDRERRWYASVLLNRLMFIYFLQRKGFIDDGNRAYLQDKLTMSGAQGKDRYYTGFLRVLFFEGFAKPEEQRSAKARTLLGKIKYLNGGLFLPHPVERNPKIDVPDQAFENLFGLFARYSWNLNDTPAGEDNEINPDVLGYIFEKYINQKAFGAYYTRPEITEYLCERTIHRLILDAINTPGVKGLVPARRFESVADLLLDLDASLCRQLLFEVLPQLTLLDPACGSGAFLVAAMKTLINVYSAVIGKITFLNARNLSAWLKGTEREHTSISYFIKKRIITDNLFGVDIMEEATEIAKLRLFLALVAAVGRVDDLEPLPNIDFNILAGNSLIGLMHVDDEQFNQRNAQGNLFRRSYQEILAEKNRLIDQYRHATSYAEDLTQLRDDIEQKKNVARATLDEILLDEFKRLSIKFEQATWEAAKKKEGKPTKRALTLADIRALRPFHWGYEFDEILNKRGGFDAIIANPPWEIFKPNSKEFFEDHSELVSKKRMRIEDFEEEKAKLLQDPEIRAAWLQYLSRFPHLSQYFRSAPEYENQIAIVDGKKAGTDINLYKLFTERCFRLLRTDGDCGIVIPSGIYTDLGSKQLREMLFSQCRVTGIFGFENRKEIFEGVHRSYKFIVLTFEKGTATESFPAAFMRLDVSELEGFPPRGAIELRVDLIRRLSPGSLSVMELKDEKDVQIAERMLDFPLLGEPIDGAWNVRLTAEFHMTHDGRNLFEMAPGQDRLPLYEGKMIHQFTHTLSGPRYWVSERKGRRALLGRSPDTGQQLDYQRYRLGFRDIARNTDERTMISTIIPPAFHGNKLPTVHPADDDGNYLIAIDEQLFLCAVWNSFALDWLLRMKVSATLNFFYIHQLPVPRMRSADSRFKAIAGRAARLICTTPEFDDLAKEVGLTSHKDGATDPGERARLRAELDGLIAHLYGLTEEEFAHILTTFPIVPDPVKIAAQNAYRDVERGLIK